MRVISTGRRSLTEDDLRRMNLPEDLWRVKVQDVPASVRASVEKYLVNFCDMALRGAGLLLMGNPGVGKSAIAALVAKEARARGYTTFFTTTFELRENIRAKIGFDEETSVLERCRDVDVLVLDRFELRDVTEHLVNLRLVEELLVHRGAQKKISVMTTQLTREKLSENSATETVLDTLTPYMVPLVVAGPDLRKSRSEELKKLVVVPKE